MRNFMLFISISALMTINVYANTPCYTATTNTLDNAYIYNFDNGSLSAQTDDVLILVDGKFTAEKLKLYKSQDTDYISIYDLLSLYSSSYIYNSKTNQLIFIINHNKFIVNIAENTVVINGTKNKSSENIIITEKTVYLPLNLICNTIGYDFGFYPVNDNYAVTKNPVLWIEKNNILKETELTPDSVCTKVQNYIIENPDLFNPRSFKELYKDVSYYQEIPVFDSLYDFQYRGQLGRYYIFTGPYTVLYNINSGAIYQYSETDNISKIEYKGTECIDLFNYNEFFT